MSFYVIRLLIAIVSKVIMIEWSVKRTIEEETER